MRPQPQAHRPTPYTYPFFAMSGFAERDSAHTESLDTHLSTVAHKKDLNVHNTGHVTLLNT